MYLEDFHAFCVGLGGETGKSSISLVVSCPLTSPEDLTPIMHLPAEVMSALLGARADSIAISIVMNSLDSELNKADAVTEAKRGLVRFAVF